MYNFPIALQLYSVRDDMEADFAGTLKKVKSFGYDGVEFAGLFGHTAEEVKKMCADAGVTPISAHVPYDELKKGDETFKTYAEIGCKYIVIPWINAEYLAGGEKNAEFYENVKKFGELANKHGMKLCYHNHDFEFEKVDGEYKLDLLYKAISPELLSTQLDTCWVNVGGENPADFVRKYNGRIEIVHLKDFAGTKGGNMYALIGNDESSKKEVSSDDWITVLEQMHQCVEQFDMDGVDHAMETMDTFQTPDKLKDLMEQLRVCVADVEMEEIMKLTDTMVNSLQ